MDLGGDASSMVYGVWQTAVNTSKGRVGNSYSWDILRTCVPVRLRSPRLLR